MQCVKNENWIDKELQYWFDCNAAKKILNLIHSRKKI
jgi:hypothetical protein